MKIGITYRLFLAILAAAGLTVLSMLLIMRWSIDRGFLRYVNSLDQSRLTRLAERLEEGYARQGSWAYLQGQPATWRQLVATTMPDEWPRFPERPPHPGEGPPPGEGGRPPGPPPPGRDFALRVILLDAARKPLVMAGGSSEGAELKPLHQGARVVGYLGLLPLKHLSDEHQLRFMKEQRLALSLGGAMLVLVAMGLSLPLASRLVRPIRALATATDRLAAGQYAIRVPVTSTDELGQLARDFNALALSLEKNEQARRQWVADISHELRTPLAILRGEIEALVDGVRQPTPASFQSLHGEVLRLGRLVDDLYQLSLSDVGALTYRKEELDLAKLLIGVLAPYRAEFAAKQLRLDAHLPFTSRFTVFGDPERLHQLFANLLDNGLKYTDQGGELVVRLSCRDAAAIVDIEDSAPGVPSSELGKLFDRLYRVEASRSRAGGGAGLGLAICRNIAEAHDGTITAQPSPLGGLWIRVTLPLIGRC